MIRENELPNSAFNLAMRMTREQRHTIRMSETRESIKVLGCNEARILALCNADVSLHEKINGRALTLAALQACTDADGMVAVSVWQRDCDHVEFTRLHRIRPSLYAWMALHDDLHEHAEGPYGVQILSLEEAEEFRRDPPRDVDRILEAFENGETYRV